MQKKSQAPTQSSYLDRLEETWLLQKAQYIAKKPLAYTILTAFNFYFVFNRFGVQYNVIAIFAWSVLALVFMQLENHHITHFLRPAKPTDKLGKFRINLFIGFTLLGIIFGIFLLIIETIISVFSQTTSLFVSLFGPSAGMKAFMVFLLLVSSLWPIEGILNREIRLRHGSAKMTGTAAIVANTFFLAMLTLAIFIILT